MSDSIRDIEKSLSSPFLPQIDAALKQPRVSSVAHARTLVAAGFWDARNKKTRDELTMRANRDSLTELYSEPYFRDELSREFKRMRRENGILAVLWCDLRDLKYYNDFTNSHAGGDKALIATAEGMKQAVRNTDTLARIHGDEYAAVLPHIETPNPRDASERLDPKDAAAYVGLRMAQSVHAQSLDIPIDSLHRTIHADIGLTLAVPGDTPESILDRTDGASYIAKRSIGHGENRIVIVTLDDERRPSYEYARLDLRGQMVYEPILNALNILATKPIT